MQLDMLNTLGAERGHLARLGLGQRRPRHDRPATPSRSGCRCRRIRFKGGDRRADGHPVLAARQPHRHVGVLAGARAGQVGVRARTRRWCFDDLKRPPTRELIPSRHLLTRARTRATPSRVGRADADARRRPQRASAGLTSDDHPRRHRQPRLQPGRERRLPGRGQPALPDLLLREAAVLHGRRRPLQPRRQRRRATRHALRRAHAAHRRSDLRRQADRVGGPRHVRQAHRRRSGAGPDRSTRSIR